MRLVEKYRPNGFDDIVGQKEIVDVIKNMVKKNEIPHLLFVGPPGTGKTSLSIVLAKELFGPSWKSYFNELNASDDRGIDMVRDRIKGLSQYKGRRIIFLDEADNMTEDAQNALRRIMERTPETIFILCGNREDKIIDPIKSRCITLRFRKLSEEQVFEKIISICKSEGIDITADDREGILTLIKESGGDIRRAINILEEITTEKKKIDAKSIIELRKPNLMQIALISAIQGDFEKSKDMVENYLINDGYNVEKLINSLYDGMDKLEINGDNDRVREIKIRIYAKLGELEMNCKRGNPLVQVVAFMATVWIIPHLSGVSKPI
jgi:replication factor C small subunit